MVFYDRPTNRWCLGTAFNEVVASAAGAGIEADIDSNPPLSGWESQADVAAADIAVTKVTHVFFASRHAWDLVALRSEQLRARQSAADHKSIMDVSLLLFFFSEHIAERRRRTAYAIHVAQFGRIWHNLAQLESVYIVMLHFFCNGVVGNTHTQSAAIN